MSYLAHQIQRKVCHTRECKKCFIMKENSKVDILMSTVTKCNLSRLPEGFYTWKENIFMAAKKSLLKFAIVFASSSFVPRIKERLIFLTASDDFKSMMQTIKDSRLLSTTQQINPESLVHSSHSRTNKSPKFSKKRKCHWPDFIDKNIICLIKIFYFLIGLR